MQAEGKREWRRGGGRQGGLNLKSSGQGLRTYEVADVLPTARVPRLTLGGGCTPECCSPRGRRTPRLGKLRCLLQVGLTAGAPGGQRLS